MSVNVPYTFSLSGHPDRPLILSSTVKYGGHHYWINCRAEDDSWWSISDSYCRKLQFLDEMSRIDSNSLMVSFALKNTPEIYFDRISSALYTVSKVVDHLHAVLSRTSKGEFWRSIRSLFGIVNEFPREELETILSGIHSKPEANLLMLRNF